MLICLEKSFLTLDTQGHKTPLSGQTVLDVLFSVSHNHFYAQENEENVYYTEPIFIMLIACKNSTKNRMMILMVLVIAMFVIVGAYVGYHASQQVEEEGKAHSINMDLELFSYQDSEFLDFELSQKNSLVIQ